ncbi:hypothetical protein KUTeg_013249 [Tegillarca granosa]|uniref:RNA helicase n=1 Tax=Tegillarca granosa TaxID=220873 RepID=A0ABQ9ET91_TEGGR|nr:hypothetical protein KUTeg_013249 [Tegillarca granosa]
MSTMIFQFTRKEVIKVVQATLRSYSRHYQNPEIPVITVPKKMLQQIQKVKQKQLKKKVEFMKLKNSPVVIECKRPEFNHHLGQKYSEFNPKVLASHGWTHYKSAGDKFTIDFKESNPSVDLEDSETTFSDLKINDHVVSNLQKMNIETPTNIQSMVIPAIFEGEHIICAAETGTLKKSRLQQLVIDEADTLLDSSFKNDVIYVIRKIGVHTGSPTGDKTYLYVSSGLQVILASATFPTGLDKSIGSVLPKRKESFEKFQNGECDILVCTDVGSRGVDTLRATQVINFDFPNAVSDYIHRAGRVGRVGSAKNCKVISFVTHKWEVNLLWNIEVFITS